MKTYEPLEERQIDTTTLETPVDLGALQGREEKRALTLSLVPGLGQLYNGESGKGLLFLGVTLANLALISLLFFTGPLLNGLLQFAAICFHTAPKIQVSHTLEIVQEGRSVTFAYLGLILSYALYAGRDAYDRARDKRRGKSLPRFVLSMPEATSGSYLLHFSIICALMLTVIFFAAPPKPQKQITDITLIQEATPPPAKKAEPPKPKQTPKLEKKEPPKPEKQAPPKLTPVAVAVPTDKAVADPVVQSNDPAPTPQPPANDTAASGSPAGNPGQEAAGDGDDVDFGNYLTEIQKRIKKAWFPPRGAESLSVTLKFRVLKDGSIGWIKLVKSTGITAADDAAKAAISNSAPFPPLPKGAGDDVDIKFTFDYNVFNGKLPAQ